MEVEQHLDEPKETLIQQALGWAGLVVFSVFFYALFVAPFMGLASFTARTWDWYWKGEWVEKPMSLYWSQPPWLNYNISNWLWAQDYAWWLIVGVPGVALVVYCMIDDANANAPQKSLGEIAELEAEECVVPDTARGRSKAELAGAVVRRLTRGWLWPRYRREDLNGFGRFGRVVHWTGVAVAVILLILAPIVPVTPGNRSLVILMFAIPAIVIALLGRVVLYIFANE